jgi:hypothetical protein
LFVRWFIRREIGRRRRNDEGQKKNVMTRGRRSKEKDWWGKSHVYSHFSIAAVPRVRSTDEKCLDMQTIFHHRDNPMVVI